MMMHNLGHEVYLYAGEVVEAPVTELITCVADSKRAAALQHLEPTELLAPRIQAAAEADRQAAQAQPSAVEPVALEL